MGFLKLLPLLLLAGCGQLCTQEPTLRDYLKYFQSKMYFHEHNVCDMKYKTLPKNWLGAALVTEYIRCDISIQYGILPFMERATALHEIAHCLGVNHYYGPTPHIMAPESPTETYLYTNWNQLEQEFIDYVKENFSYRDPY